MLRDTFVLIYLYEYKYMLDSVCVLYNIIYIYIESFIHAIIYHCFQVYTNEDDKNNKGFTLITSILAFGCRISDFLHSVYLYSCCVSANIECTFIQR